MKMSTYLTMLSLLFMAAHLHSEEPTLSEKICAISPDQKFAVRILYDEKENEKDAPQLKEERTSPLIEGIFWPSVKAVDIVSLPAKEKVVELTDSEGNGNLTLMWSADSRWCAFYQNEVNDGYTSVFNQRDGKFVKLDDLNDLHLKFKGNFRKEWIEPIRWMKPGVLILHDEVAGENGSQGFEVTVRFDEEGKPHVIGQKKLKESS
jgi:hypothetical protein